jgi:diguanylate cyclase (GGDEF)-like protein
MKSKVSKRSDREIIVMSLSLTYALCVSVFAAIRLINEDWVIGILDVILAAFGMYVFIHVWRTRNSQLPAYAIAVISVVGTLATLVLKGPEQIYWAYPSVALVFYLLPNKHALILWGITAAVMLALLVDLPALQLMTVAMTIFITSFFCYFFSAKMNQQHNRLRRIANEDVLTQIKNRRAFNQDIEKIEVTTSPESAILFDLDNFKQINDYFGHAKGDEVLIQASAFINALLGNQDSLYRIGGDEFAILCHGEDFNHAFKLAQTIHDQFKAGQLHEKHGMTLSMAVAEKEPNESIREWFSRLDGALYKAKKSGRDRIVKAIRY